MKRLLLASLVLFAAALAAWFAWIGPALTDGGSAPAPASTESVDSRVRGVEASELRALAEDDAPAPVRAVVDSSPAAPAPGEGGWIVGRVSRPAGCPDDSLRVYLLTEGMGLDDFFEEIEASTDSAPVAADGTFRIGRPAGARGEVWLGARGAFLYAAPRSYGPDDEPVLEALAGARLAGRIVAPEGEELGPLEVRLRSELAVGDAMGVERTDSLRLEQKPEADGRFEFRSLPAAGSYTLEVLPERWAAARVDVPPREACATRDLEVALDAGRTVRGRVVGPAGRGLEGAEVRASFPGEWFGFDDVVVREAESDDEGSFVLTAVPAGRLGVRAEREGYLESKRQTVEVPPEGEVDGLVLELGAGNSISGDVRREDGTPAEGAVVEVTFDTAHMAGPSALNALRGANGRATSDAEGRFEILGLGAGPFTVRARLETESPEGAHQARRDGIAPGTSGIELRLHPPLGLHGRVVDSSGAPVTSFRLRAARISDGAFGSFGLERRDETFEDDQGRFFLAGVPEGTWHLWARGEQHASVEPTAVEVPSAATEDDPLLVAVSLTATAKGTVRSPDGRPLAGARVASELDGPNWMQNLSGAPSPPSTATGDEGTFELTGLASGSVTLRATAESFAAGPPETLELEPGEVVEGIELGLILGGTLTGEVYDSEGERAAGTLVSLTRMSMDQRTAISDGRGEFRFEHLQPGAWQVVAMDRGGDWSGMAEGDFGGMMRSMRLAQADVVDGETTHVVLGAPPEDPVLVHGRVTHGGEPWRGCLVSFYPEGSKLYERMLITSAGDDGRYELTLNGSGVYTITVQRITGGAGQQQSIEFSHDVPAADEYRLDFEIPLGRISGRVFGPDGEGAGGARVTLSPDGGMRSDSLLGGQYAEVQTDPDGRYDLDGLRPGSYAISAGGVSPFSLGSATGAAPGRMTRSGLKVGEDEWLRGVDFRLPAPGSLEVRVQSSAGTPLGDAVVFVRESGGRPIESFTMASTDAAGRYVQSGLAPGDYTVSARKDLEASPESPTISVRAGESSQLELRTAPGTVLWVTLESGGEPVRASVSVIDSNGHEWASMFGLDDLQALYIDGGFSATEHRVGPLPQGRYTVSAKAADGRSDTKPVTLDGRPERKLTLRLD